jgi:hypothetical protein
MSVRLAFALSTVMSLIGSIVFARFYVWPWLRDKKTESATALLIAPHLFVRFIGLSFLVPGVVGASLPAAFAIPAAYGDLGAGILAILATLALSRRASGASAAVWIFNAWGAADLLFAIYQGLRLQIDAGEFGAAFYIPTAIVPPLLVTHGMIFKLLLRDRR